MRCKANQWTLKLFPAIPPTPYALPSKIRWLVNLRIGKRYPCLICFNPPSPLHLSLLFNLPSVNHHVSKASTFCVTIFHRHVFLSFYQSSHSLPESSTLLRSHKIRRLWWQNCKVAQSVTLWGMHPRPVWGTSWKRFYWLYCFRQRKRSLYSWSLRGGKRGPSFDILKGKTRKKNAWFKRVSGIILCNSFNQDEIFREWTLTVLFCRTCYVGHVAYHAFKN